jgi:hypothetical protein
MSRKHWLFVCVVLFGCALILMPLVQPASQPIKSLDGYGPGPDGVDSEPLNGTIPQSFLTLEDSDISG